MSRLTNAIAAVTAGIEDFKFQDSIAAAYEFAWNEFCDWYLEAAKQRLRDGDADRAGRRVLLPRPAAPAAPPVHAVRDGGALVAHARPQRLPHARDVAGLSVSRHRGRGELWPRDAHRRGGSRPPPGRRARRRVAASCTSTRRPIERSPAWRPGSPGSSWSTSWQRARRWARRPGASSFPEGAGDGRRQAELKRLNSRPREDGSQARERGIPHQGAIRHRQEAGGTRGGDPRGHRPIERVAEP